MSVAQLDSADPTSGLSTFSFRTQLLTQRKTSLRNRYDGQISKLQTLFIHDMISSACSHRTRSHIARIFSRRSQARQRNLSRRELGVTSLDCGRTASPMTSRGMSQSQIGLHAHIATSGLRSRGVLVFQESSGQIGPTITHQGWRYLNFLPRPMDWTLLGKSLARSRSQGTYDASPSHSHPARHRFHGARAARHNSLGRFVK